MTANQKYQKERAKVQEGRVADTAFRGWLYWQSCGNWSDLRLTYQHKRLQLI